MSRALSKKEQSQQVAQQHQGQEQYARDVETTEHKSSANASCMRKAGLNLNLFSALSGALSSTKRKETTNKPDGSKHTVEDSHDKGIFPLSCLRPSSSLFFLLCRARDPVG
ncbi:palmitoyltransferase swf1 [Paraconiothyrium brasiliense]|uniref:Palmitoyltransferase swf1 n=1 Tax=Paraconiothyrium brasiliense TaxID=300254 RepID=A0ABR3S1V5_9PLEO